MSKKEKKPMTKAKKSLLITLLVLIVLGVSTAVLYLYRPRKPATRLTAANLTVVVRKAAKKKTIRLRF